MEEARRVPSEPGPRKPSPDGLGPSGFDPSREVYGIPELEVWLANRAEILRNLQSGEKGAIGRGLYAYAADVVEGLAKSASTDLLIARLRTKIPGSKLAKIRDKSQQKPQFSADLGADLQCDESPKGDGN